MGDLEKASAATVDTSPSPHGGEGGLNEALLKNSPGELPDPGWISDEAKRCLGQWCARLGCLLATKLLLLFVLLNALFAWGSAGDPVWTPISTSKACERNDDWGSPRFLTAEEPLPDLQACLQACQRHKQCQAVDWYSGLAWCRLYEGGCFEPTAGWSGASSYEEVVACRLQNGTSGVLVRGRCHGGWELPSPTSTWQQDAWVMLTSPTGWALAALMATAYSIVASTESWTRLLRGLTTAISAAPTLRRAPSACTVTAIWSVTTVVVWELASIECGTRRLRPVFEAGWLVLTLLVFLTTCWRCFRATLVMGIHAVGGSVMWIFSWRVVPPRGGASNETGLKPQALTMAGVEVVTLFFLLTEVVLAADLGFSAQSVAAKQAGVMAASQTVLCY